jgi:hypothetical protein
MLSAAIETAPVPRHGAGISGPPSCRIFPCHDDVWALEFDAPASGSRTRLESYPWVRRLFPKLADAIAYAERHGFVYRVCHRNASALPKAWVARVGYHTRKA